MIRILLNFSLFFMAMTALNTWAVTVQDSKGAFSIDYVPKRIVVLEFSFADALAIVDVKPVGVADDKDPVRLLPDIRAAFGSWQSVGTRSQPSLEVISELKPDLIIADIYRHEGVYSELRKIAPTLMLPSKRQPYGELLKATAIIGNMIGKDQKMTARLREHERLMSAYKQQLPQGMEVQVGVARDDALFLHSSDSYTGGIIDRLGLKFAKSIKDDTAPRQASMEQLLLINPENLIIGEYVKPSILGKWQHEPLWSLLKCVQNHRIFGVDAMLWGKNRGVLASEKMAADLVSYLGIDAESRLVSQ
ncbi:Fe(3+) dicitrate ABC transporter substrate-binding protein [Marinomonas mediterranea]|uniref:Fe(3+) dicitrate ABC transporter substrate-binding protein n=1 Tax=Marinomonas mediterranea TaxID=119864 RepID=UPI002349E8E1|nr:Fe(3+) dicitrate ABC transporter substrate-binding protein [Marinomonas mediterranea]WCN08747.1 ABC transporter substrate-binding protein [Marinomonas mediterranea]